MNIICDKSLLSSAADGAARAVTTRSGNPALEGLHLQAVGDKLTITGYDMEIAITISISCSVRVTGECVVNAKMLCDIVRRMPSGDVSIELHDNGTVTVKGGVAEFELTALDINSFPDLPQPGADPTLTIKAADLHDIIDKTIYAVSQDDSKPAHTGELFVFEPEKLTVVALDGYRLAIVCRNYACKKEIRTIIPSKTILEVNRLVGNGEDDEVTISANRRFVVFTASNGYTIMSRLIEGEFLNYETVLPKGSRTQVTLETRDFIESIERASLIITERLKNPLRISFVPDKVLVRCHTSLGKVADEFGAEIKGEQIEIGFNNRYLLDALRASKCEKVRLEISGSLSPVKILPSEGDDFIYLVLPVRFKND